MNFDCIILTKEELIRLRELAANPNGLPPEKQDSKLVNNLLVARERSGSKDPEVGVPYCVQSVITMDGKNYLAYLSNIKRARRKEHAHNWIIAIFSAIFGALLSEPLWALIRQIID